MNMHARLALALALCAGTAAADTLIRGATVIDGSGQPGYVADVTLRDGLIAGIGKVTPRAGDTVVDAKGLVLAPGFIDAHSHHERGLEPDLEARSAISQGITTAIVGVDGTSELPLGDWFAMREKSPASINFASFTGHGSVRKAVLGADYRRIATPAEVKRMEALLAADMKAGALGLSSGLEYDPGIYSNTAELVSLAKVASASGGIYTSHVRSEDVALDQAQDEAATIGREAKIRVQLSHLKISLIDNWGQASAMLKRIEGWRAEGIDIAADVYPYTYWYSSIVSVFPKRDFDNIEASRHALKHVAHADGIIIEYFAPEPRYKGMTVAQIAKERGQPEAETLQWLIKRAYPDGNVDTPDKREGVMGVSMSEEDVSTFLDWPLASICSDGDSDGGHPRGAGAFTRYLRHYVLDKDPSTLPDAIRRSTSLTAQRYGIPNRGLIAVGRAADVVLIDTATVRDNANLQDSLAVSSGITSVWVNGEQVWDGTKSTGKRPGEIVRRM
jgi:N-acyl-D-amino-acid deacylase